MCRCAVLLRTWDDVSFKVSYEPIGQAYQWNVVARFVVNHLCQLFVILDKMRNVDVAKELI